MHGYRTQQGMGSGRKIHLSSVYVPVEEKCRFSTLMSEAGRGMDFSHIQQNKYILIFPLKDDPRDLKGSLSNSTADS